MSKKGHTAPLSASVRNARDRRKAVSQLRDLRVCMEFYYDHRTEYTSAELTRLENVVTEQQLAVKNMPI